MAPDIKSKPHKLPVGTFPEFTKHLIDDAMVRYIQQVRILVVKKFTHYIH
jgi:hypothetical protein